MVRLARAAANAKTRARRKAKRHAAVRWERDPAVVGHEIVGGDRIPEESVPRLLPYALSRPSNTMVRYGIAVQMERAPESGETAEEEQARNERNRTAVTAAVQGRDSSASSLVLDSDFFMVDQGRAAYEANMQQIRESTQATIDYVRRTAERFGPDVNGVSVQREQATENWELVPRAV